MRLSCSIGVLVVVAGLAGCAGTAATQGGSAPQVGTSPAAEPEGAGSEIGQIGGGAGPGQAIGSNAGANTGETFPNGRPDLKRSVYYAFDVFDVKPEYRALVESHAKWLRANPRARLTIEGNADERGSREYNLALGQRRAESVTRMMAMLGVNPEQIEAVSFGKEKPRAAGHDETAWSENRRSDFADR
jgi:peptidoglycan-associated lipoprotein